MKNAQSLLQKKRLPLALTLACSVLVACGTDSPQSSASGPNDGTNPSEVEIPDESGFFNPPSGKVTLTFKRTGSASATARLSSDDSRVVCNETTCSVELPVGSALTLKAVPAAGSRFTGWYDAPECNNAFTGKSSEPYAPACEFKATQNRTITASFSNAPTVAQQDALSADSVTPLSRNIACFPSPTITSQPARPRG